jgi:predicted glycogen debranching enzyme
MVRGFYAANRDLSHALAPMISVPQSTLNALELSSRLEWLETSGNGAFAMGTASGMNTRRYHALLVATLKPPVERCVTLSRLEERVDIGGEGFELAVNAYPGVTHPRGHERLVGFKLDPFPVWTWQVGEARLEKRLFLVRGQSSVVVRYVATAGCTLTLRPLIAFRDYHALQHENGGLDRGWEPQLGRFEIRPYLGRPSIRFFHDGLASHDGEGWYRATQYAEEAARGLDCEEDLWCLGDVRYVLAPNQPVFLAATTEANVSFSAAGLDALEQAERVARAPRAISKDEPVQALIAAADAYRAKRADGNSTVLAGFPWFTDWGRDTMICLPGLLISRGLLDEAAAVIDCFLSHLDQGLIPNRFPDSGERPEYNTADATLWLFVAVHQLVAAGAEPNRVRDQVLPKLLEIIGWHERGTHHDIRIDADGLLSAGSPGTQLTWMDAKVGEWVVTPRHGKAVELNALWFNALEITQRLCAKFGYEAEAKQLAVKAARVAAAFTGAFWNAERKCLYDVVRGNEKDGSLRPNQLFAVSLPFSPLRAEHAAAVLESVRSALLTPYGLRTLARGEPGYRGRYEGDGHSRDGAYHQGTVWPWLLGPYVDATLRVKGRSEQTLAECAELLQPLQRRMLVEGCLGQIAEVFDAEPPYRAGGTPAQAWSVAELLRVHLSVLR